MRVLVVDDEPNMIRLMQKTLERKGYQVETASDGEDAVAKVRENQPDVLVCDSIMPKMTGWEVLAMLRADARFSSMVIIATPEGPTLVNDAIKAEIGRYWGRVGADMVLFKPINPIQLGRFVDRATGKI